LIDFRYHLVSIVAVFLALAVGIIVGASAIQPEVVSGLKAESQLQKKTNERLQAANSVLTRQLNVDDLFGQTNSGSLLDHILQGEQVVVVTAPGYDGRTVTGVTSALRQAGATVTGQVNLTVQFFDISENTESSLTALAQRLVPAGISLSGSAAAGQIAGQQAAAQVIAAAIVHQDGQAVVTSTQIQRILYGFGAEGFLQVSGPGGGPALAGQATLAVVVIPAVAPANASSPGQSGPGGVRPRPAARQRGRGAGRLAARVGYRQRHRCRDQRRGRDSDHDGGQREHERRADHGRPGATQHAEPARHAGRLRRDTQRGAQPAADRRADAVPEPVRQPVGA